MRIRPLLRLFAVFASLSILHAQPRDDGELYVPPHLTMEGAVQESFYSFGLGEPRNNVDSAMSSRAIVLRYNYFMITENLLPMVFFDAPGSSSIAPRYRLLPDARAAESYSDTMFAIMSAAEYLSSSRDDMSRSRLYEVIDILGYRLRWNPETSLMIEGGYSGDEESAVGEERANVVREHLIAVWGIAPERLRTLPPRKLCESSAPLCRQQEARRVTFRSDSMVLFKPINYCIPFLTGYILKLRVTVDPRFRPEQVRSVQLSVAVGDALVYRGTLQRTSDTSLYHLTGLVPLLWAVDAPNDPVIAQAVVTLADGRRYLSNESRLPFEVDRPPIRNELLLEGWKQDQWRVDPSGLGEFEIPFFESGSDSVGVEQELYLRRVLDTIAGLQRNHRQSSVWRDQRSSDSASYDHHYNYYYYDRERYPEMGITAPRSFTVLDPSDTPSVGIEVPVEASELIGDIALARYEDDFNFLSRNNVGPTIASKLSSRTDPPQMFVVNADTVNEEAWQRAWLGMSLDSLQASSLPPDTVPMLTEKVEADSRAVWLGMHQADTLQRKRAVGLRQWLTSHLSDTGRVSIGIPRNSAITGFFEDDPSHTSLHYRLDRRTPEGRMLARRVQIRISFVRAPYKYANRPPVPEGAPDPRR